MSTAYLFRPSLVVLSASLLALPIAAHAQSEINIPVLVPVTGFLALEGTSQRNGALLAIKNAPASVKIKSEVSDTGASPEGATTALERSLARGKVTDKPKPWVNPRRLKLAAKRVFASTTR